MAQEILLTAAGLKELQDELENLKVVGRQEIKEKIQVALSFGDLSENSEYDEARNDQGKLEARISEIEAILANAKIIDEDTLSTDIIQMGSKVTIKDVEYGDIYKYQDEEDLDNFVEDLPITSKAALRKLRKVIFDDQLINFY